jgi:heme-degrading monooxygenase HmoA
MIARVWHGTVPASKSEEYLRRLRSVAIPDYRSVTGNLGAFVLRHLDGDVAHFLTLSFWESRERIVSFAGENIDVAKYYDFDRDFLLEFESYVKHYELYGD